MCPPNFRGVTCAEKISKCESQPCQNEGTCIEDELDGLSALALASIKENIAKKYAAPATKILA